MQNIKTFTSYIHFKKSNSLRKPEFHFGYVTDYNGSDLDQHQDALITYERIIQISAGKINLLISHLHNCALIISALLYNIIST